MAQSVVLSKGIYIDSQGIWDNNHQQTQEELIAALESRIAHLEHGTVSSVSWSDICRMVDNNTMSMKYPVGTQLITTWTDTALGETYECPLDIVHYGDVELEDGTVLKHRPYLQFHYATPFGIPFDANEALYVPIVEMAPGTYYFTIGDSLGSNLYVKGTTIQFTLTNAVPAGGQLLLPKNSVNQANISDFKMYTYESPASMIAIETVQCSIGSSGTSLGTLSLSTKCGASGLNNMYRCNSGYNRWSQSGIRQWLNSKADKGKWWTPQNPFDRAPDELSSKNGFMSGFSEDFLSLLKPIKITTALNTVSDSAIGTSEDTYDTFFLPSGHNINCKDLYGGVEGGVWDYWYSVTNREVQRIDNSTNNLLKTFDMKDHNYTRDIRLRSVELDSARSTYNIHSNGGVGSNIVLHTYNCAPVCAIC